VNSVPPAVQDDPQGAPPSVDDMFSADPYANRFLYTGREFLKEANLYDYRNRVYSAELGRFLQTDPIRFDAGDGNLYRYVANNLVNAIDPFGLQQYSNQTAAARAATKAINPSSIANNVEHCGNVCKDDKTGKFFTTGPVTGTIAGCNPSSAPCPPCSKWVAYWHTHGAFNDANDDGIDDYDSENFSPTDRSYADRNKVDGCVGTPKGQFKHYDHNGKKDYTKKPL
jgi:RHS repeat-associated protein